MSERIHVLGICGTFMAGMAQLGRALGYQMEGSDNAAYPPMSDQLAQAGIDVYQPYAAEHLIPTPHMTVVGNALTRGNPAVEYLLDQGLPMTSGPQWLAEHILKGREVIAVSGTHGKTTTSSMVAQILDCAGLAPGFLIGGVPADFGVSARIGRVDGTARTPFVVEADEYDTAFFDKRSKFVHYRPRVLVINNIEFDHADIFDSIADIRRQFHHVIRTVPASGRIICPVGDPEVDATLAVGCWTPIERIGTESANWTLQAQDPAYSRFTVVHEGEAVGDVAWTQIGRHNALNGLAAIAAANAVGVLPADACRYLSSFSGVKRRLEVFGVARNITVYDDFAHHPTAIEATLTALRARVGSQRILAVLDPASNTMKMGIHQNTLAGALAAADEVWMYASPGLAFDLAQIANDLPGPARVVSDLESLVDQCTAAARPGDHVLVMSNGGFGGTHQRLLDRLSEPS